jgi:hypothetical protein
MFEAANQAHLSAVYRIPRDPTRFVVSKDMAFTQSSMTAIVLCTANDLARRTIAGKCSSHRFKVCQSSEAIQSGLEVVNRITGSPPHCKGWLEESRKFISISEVR